MSIINNYNEYTISILPLDVKEEILLNSPIETIFSYCKTNKKESKICLDDWFWLKKSAKDFKISTDELKSINLNGFRLYFYLTQCLIPINIYEQIDYLYSRPKQYASITYYQDDISIVIHQRDDEYYFESSHIVKLITNTILISTYNSNTSNIISNSHDYISETINNFEFSVINELDLLSQYNILLTQRKYPSVIAKSLIINKLDIIYQQYANNQNNPYVISFTYLYLYSHGILIGLPLSKSLNQVIIKNAKLVDDNEQILTLKTKIDGLYNIIKKRISF